jgi:hypothetical protein
MDTNLLPGSEMTSNGVRFLSQRLIRDGFEDTARVPVTNET